MTFTGGLKITYKAETHKNFMVKDIFVICRSEVQDCFEIMKRSQKG